jgi:glucosyl-dolichyl phosphate glucuronosyltransferase
VLFAPAGLLPRRSTRLIGARWRLAYALGFIRAAVGWNPDAAARLDAETPLAIAAERV